MNKKPYYPHRITRNTWTFIVFAGIAVIIIISLSSCKKDSPSDREKEHGDWKIREKAKRMVYQDSVNYNSN